MFTSGTTGQPKAARITNRRMLFAATAACGLCATPTDTVYLCLPFITRRAWSWQPARRSSRAVAWRWPPLFGQPLLAGCPAQRRDGGVLRRRDVPPRLGAAFGAGKDHAVRLFVGNGLRAEVWRQPRCAAVQSAFLSSMARRKATASW